MLEVIDRDGLARRVLWDVKKDLKVTTPLVLFLIGNRFLPFPEAEAYLSISGDLGIEEGPTLHAYDGSDIPKGLVCPMTLSHLIDRKELGEDGSGLAMLAGPVPPINVAQNVDIVVAGNLMSMVGDPKKIVNHIVGLREAVGFSRLIYAPGIGDPCHIALFSYLGIDIFDSIPLALSSRRGTLLFPESRQDREKSILADICHCPACSSLKHGSTTGGYSMGLLHNYHQALQESKRVRHAISQGLIRELVESRVRSEPWQVAALRELDLRFYGAFERYLPINKPFLQATSRESLHRPEVARFQKRLRVRYIRPPSGKVLLLLPCSARKPYSGSATHRAISNVLSRTKVCNMVHKVVLTSPLGVVPMDLETFYPANVYDIAVSGDWDGPEITMIRDGLSWLISKGNYDVVISYVEGMPFIEDIVRGHPLGTTLDPKGARRKEELKELVTVLDGSVDYVTGNFVKKGKRFAEDIKALSRFQFGAGGEDLMTRVKRSRNVIRLFDGDEMSGTLDPSRGLISLTLKGGETLLSKGLYTVDIENFEPKGTVFAIGVNGASGDIRPGDDVVVARNDDLVGVGVARMSGPEMVEARRGPAVKLRHRRK